MQTYTNPSIYLVDTDIFYSNIVEHYIVLNNINHVKTFETLSECLDPSTQAPSFIFVNEEMLGSKKYSINNIKKRFPETDVVVLSESMKVKNAVNALNAGAIDFIDKNAVNQEVIRDVIERSYPNAFMSHS